MAMFVATQRRHGPGILLSQHHVAQQHQHLTPYIIIDRTDSTPQWMTDEADNM
jgi:hypothetical protein